MNTQKSDETEISKTTAVGRSLLGFSRETEFSARRGVIADLFPYVVAASKRMSARAITRFLEKEHGIKISAVTVAKAIRSPAKYWMLFFDTIEPYARQVAEAHNISIQSLLFDQQVYEHFCHTDESPKHLAARDGEEFEVALDRYREANNMVEETWFDLDEELRREAQGYLEKHLDEFQKKVIKDEE